MTDLDVGELLDRATLAADAPIRDLERLPGRRLQPHLRRPDGRPARRRQGRAARAWRRCATATCCARRGCCARSRARPCACPRSWSRTPARRRSSSWTSSPASPTSPRWTSRPRRRRRRSCAPARWPRRQMLAELQRVPAPGRRASQLPLREELDRWQRLYATVPEELHYAQDELHRRLAASLPARVAPAILHGDYRIGNMQFDGERLAAHHRLGDLVARRPAHRPRLAAHLARPGPGLLRAPQRGGRARRRRPARPAPSCSPPTATEPSRTCRGSRPTAATRWPPRPRCWSSTTGAARSRSRTSRWRPRRSRR